MSDSLLDRYAGRLSEATKKPEEEAPENLGAFGLLRGIHDRALMLELRFQNGNAEAFPYHYLHQASFDPSVGITLRFGAKGVKIVGTNLGVSVRPSLTLFQAILRQRVPWIQEADRQTALAAPPNSPIVDEIEMLE